MNHSNVDDDNQDSIEFEEVDLKPEIVCVNLELNKIPDVKAHEKVSAVNVKKFKKEVEARYEEENVTNTTKEINGDDSENTGAQKYRTYKCIPRLRYHMKSVNIEDNRADCEVCKKKFLNKNRLATHMYFSHPELNENVTCDICSKSFKRLHNLKMHIRQAHTTTQSPPPTPPVSNPACTCKCDCQTTMSQNLTTNINQLDIKINSMQNQLTNMNRTLTRISQMLTLIQPPLSAHNRPSQSLQDPLNVEPTPQKPSLAFPRFTTPSNSGPTKPKALQGSSSITVNIPPHSLSASTKFWTSVRGRPPKNKYLLTSHTANTGTNASQASPVASYLIRSATPGSALPKQKPRGRPCKTGDNAGRQCLLCGLYFSSKNIVRHYGRIHPSYLEGLGKRHPNFPKRFYFRTFHPLDYCPPNLKPPLSDLVGVENLNRRFLELEGVVLESAASSKTRTSAWVEVSPRAEDGDVPTIRSYSGRVTRTATRK